MVAKSIPLSRWRPGTVMSTPVLVSLYTLMAAGLVRLVVSLTTAVSLTVRWIFVSAIASCVHSLLLTVISGAASTCLWTMVRPSSLRPVYVVLRIVSPVPSPSHGNFPSQMTSVTFLSSSLQGKKHLAVCCRHATHQGMRQPIVIMSASTCGHSN